ncbi:MAG: carboxypeptidase-like regulatory domain-containing protein [Chitinophagales bacterium]|nr:carboxypeptidase-like regulatory domain-containing protein [Chitinophagales bacterium]
MRTILLLFILLSITSCKKRITGYVHDNFGKSVNNVSVTISNSNFHSSTDDNGRFEIDYVPGEIKLLYEKEGYVSDTQVLSIYKKSNYEATKIMLIKKPEQRGVYYQSFNSYIPLTEVKTEKYDIASHWEQYTVEWYVKEFECVQIPYSYVGPQPLYTLAIQDFFKNNSGFVSYPKCLSLYKIYGDNGEFATLKGSYIEGAKILQGKKIKMDFTEKDKTLLITADLDYGKYVLTREAYAPWLATDPSFMFELVDTTKTPLKQSVEVHSKRDIQDEPGFVGYITNIDGGNALITITVQESMEEETGDGQELSFLLSASTRIISKNPKYKTLADIENNLKVIVRYSNSNGDIIDALSVEILE